MTDDWRSDAACLGVDPDLFFPERGGDGRGAKAVCAECPVTAECLDFALINSEKFGIWGGKSERERGRIRSRLPMPERTTWLDRAVCGTTPGYKKHLHEGTPTCEPCRRANALSKQLNKERQSA